MRNVALPDDLFSRLESEATRRGVDPENLAARLVETGLGADAAPARGRKGPIPVRIDGSAWTFPYLTNAELVEAMDGDGE